MLFHAGKLKSALSLWSSQTGRGTFRSYNLKCTPCIPEEKPLYNLSCKTALITGGTGGMGVDIAHNMLCKDAKRVALIGRDPCKGRDAINILNCRFGQGKAIFIKGDVTCKEQLSESFQKVMSEFGQIDMVINAAGILDGKNWENELATNFMATVRSTILAYKYMSKVDSGYGGVVLNISGLPGLDPLAPAPTLTAGHHGIIGLSRSFGACSNFDRTGVRVLTLCPGVTQTPFIKDPAQKAFDSHMGQELEVFMREAKRQNTDVCGKAALHLLLYAPSGSVWTVEASKLYSLEIPHWKSYAQLKSQFI